MRKHIPLGLAVAAWIFLCRLASPPITAEEGKSPLKVVASLFPQYDFAKHVGGSRAEVRMLLPPGVESHSYEPTPADMKRMADADIFIHTGRHMEPWAARVAAATVRPGGVMVVDASRGVIHWPEDVDEGGRDDHGDDGNHDGSHDDEETGGHFHEFDPHIWLDPILAMGMIDNIADAMARRDPENAGFYRANADTLKSEVRKLHEDFRAAVDASPRRTLVFGDRFAFSYFFSRYGLDEVGPYNSCAPGAGPGMKAIIETVEYVREHGVKVIYRESRTAGRVAGLIAEETGVDSLPVDSLHNPTAEQLRAGFNYADAMRNNMDAFSRGLR